jgi:hypothetical protein
MLTMCFINVHHEANQAFSALVAALWFERHLRRMGKAGLQAMRQRVAQSKVVSFRFPPRGDSTRGE